MKSSLLITIAVSAVCWVRDQPAGPPTCLGQGRRLDARLPHRRWSVRGAGRHAESRQQRSPHSGRHQWPEQLCAGADGLATRRWPRAAERRRLGGRRIPDRRRHLSRQCANPDVVQRAATQQRTAEPLRAKGARRRTQGLPGGSRLHGIRADTRAAQRNSRRCPKAATSGANISTSSATDASVLKSQAVAHTAGEEVVRRQHVEGGRQATAAGSRMAPCRATGRTGTAPAFPRFGSTKCSGGQPSIGNTGLAELEPAGARIRRPDPAPVVPRSKPSSASPADGRD